MFFPYPGDEAKECFAAQQSRTRWLFALASAR